MGNKLKLLVLIVVTLLNTQGCIESNPSNVIEPKTDPVTGITYSTAVVGTVPPSVDIVFDDTSFYFYDTDNKSICKMNKVTGQKNVLNIGNSAFNGLSLDGNYLYGYNGGFNSRLIYRIDKNFTTSPEQIIFSLEKNVYQMKAGGGYLYIEYVSTSNTGTNKIELCKYDILKKETISIGSQSAWFDTDSENVYWMSIDSLSNRTLWKMAHNSSSPVKLVYGQISSCKMSESDIYYWDNDENLLRVSKKYGTVETIVSASGNLFDDNGFIVKNELLFVTDCFDATLSVCSLKSLQNRFTTLEKKGRFDEDDMNCWLWADKDALYWVAGPNEDTQISDEQWGTLFRTVVKENGVKTERW
jgi:hypothetical protein